MKIFYTCCKLIALLTINLILPGSLHAQKIKFKERLKVIVDGKNENYEVIFLDPRVNQEEIKTITYDATNNAAISYTKTKKTDWKAAIKFETTGANIPAYIKNTEKIIADIKAEDGRLMIYFWPFYKKEDILENDPTLTAEIAEVNKFFKDHSFSIELPDRLNLGFSHGAIQAGIMTLPIRVFLGGPDSVSTVASAVNIGPYVGWRWGKTRFVKLPDEKEITTYERSQSVNFIFGIGKLDLDDKNTVDDGKVFKGSVGVLSTGISLGFHYKTFSLFGAIGIDHPLSKRGELWSLKGKPWIGFGAGFEIF